MANRAKATDKSDYRRKIPEMAKIYTAGITEKTKYNRKSQINKKAHLYNQRFLLVDAVPWVLFSSFFCSFS